MPNACVGQLPVDFGGCPRGKDLQRRGDEAGVGNRLAEHHEDNAHHLAIGIAQLLSSIALGSHLAQHGSSGVKLLHCVGHCVLALAQQPQAGGAGEVVLGVGQHVAVQHGRQSGDPRGLALRLRQQAHHAATLCAQCVSHVAHQLHKKLGTGAGRYGRSHLEHRRLQLLLCLVRAQAHDAEGHVVGQLLQQFCLFFADLQDFGGIQVQQAEGAVAIPVAQRQADHAVKAMLEHAPGPVGKVALKAGVLHDHRLA